MRRTALVEGAQESFYPRASHVHSAVAGTPAEAMWPVLLCSTCIYCIPGAISAQQLRLTATGADQQVKIPVSIGVRRNDAPGAPEANLVQAHRRRHGQVRYVSHRRERAPYWASARGAFRIRTSAVSAHHCGRFRGGHLGYRHCAAMLFTQPHPAS